MKILLVLLLVIPSWGQTLHGAAGIRGSADLTRRATGIAYVNAQYLGNSTGNFSASYTAGSAANSLLVIAIAGDVIGGADDITGVTFNSVSATLIAKYTANGDRITYAYRLVAPASGAHTLAVTTTGSHFLSVVVGEYSGVDQTTPVPESTSGMILGTGVEAGGGSLVTTVDNSWVVMVTEGYYSGEFPGAGTGSTRRAYDTTFGVNAIFDNAAPKTPAGTVTMHWGYIHNSFLAHIMFSINPA